MEQKSVRAWQIIVLQLDLFHACAFFSSEYFVPSMGFERESGPFPLQMGNQSLVLDVVESTSSVETSKVRQKKYKIVLRAKEPGRRSQLWRMTTDGKLAHEGTSPPQDPKHFNPLKSQENMLVIIFCQNDLILYSLSRCSSLNSVELIWPSSSLF
jgi:hypothetical protein